MKLKAGDTLKIPKGWTVELRNGRLELYHKNYSADSPRGYSYYEFFAQASGYNKPIK